MAETLTTVLQQLITDLGQWIKIGNEHEFTATGGSATTAVNSSFANLDDPPEEEALKDHVLFVSKDTAGASPEGRYGLISAYNVDTWTITHATVTDAIASGDKFKIASQSTFPFSDLISAINGGLRELGIFTFVDRSLTTADNQTEFSLPSGVVTLIGVKIKTNNDSNDNEYKWINGCKIVPPTTTLSTAPLLYIPQQSSGYALEVHYNGFHPTLSTYSDPIYPFLQKELIVASAMTKLLRGFINEGAGQMNEHWRNMYNEATRLKETFKLEMPMYRERPRKNRLQWPTFGETE